MNNRGMALVAGLILLTAVSLLAVTAARGTALAYRQASNLEDEGLARANARLAEVSARAWLMSRPDIERESGCLNDCLLPPAIHSPGALPKNPAFESAAWWEAHGHRAGTHPESGTAMEQDPDDDMTPLWVMEEIHFATIDSATGEPDVGGIAYYRVISRGIGKRSRSVAITETLLARPWEGGFDNGPFPAVADAPDFCSQFNRGTPCGTVAWRRLR